jgi:2-phospho-L-lactate guanylyltransferase (CobY/MobA/RfbA family)
VRPCTSILIPVKATGRAKGRLAELLDQAARQELALITASAEFSLAG